MQDREQQIRAKAILEVIGKPKEYIVQKMKEYIEKIKEDEHVFIITENVSDAEEHEKVWSIIAEIEVIVKGLSNLVGFCIEYMPSSIEILKPEEFHFPERTFTEFMNDLVAKLHMVDMVAKRSGTENIILKDTLSKIIKNHILVAIKFGINIPEKISKSSGLALEEVKRYLNMLVKEGRIKEQNNVYSLKHG